MPGWQLRMRPSTGSQSVATITNASGYLIALEPDPNTSSLRMNAGQPGNSSYVKNLPPEHAYRLLASGNAHALVSAKDTTTTVEIGLGTSAGPQIRGTFPNIGQGDVGMREYAGTVTLWHRDGRILVAAAGELLASLRLAP
jgi:hypothetical protein